MTGGAAAHTVSIGLLGEFEIRVGDRRVTSASIARRDPLRLAEYLSLAPGRRAHREQVIDELWPDVDPGSVGNRLHKAAHFLRRSIALPTSVVLGRETVALLPAERGLTVTVDADLFEQLARAAADPVTPPAEQELLADRALALYRGDLLPAEPYEEWAFHHRQRLQLRHRDLLRRRHRFAELVALDPLDEDAHVGLMRELLRTGDRRGVIRQFTVLTEVLAREVGVGPSAEARAVRDLAGGPGAVASAPAAPRAASLATQRVNFCRTPDGVRLAFGVSGSGPPLVKASNWLTHLDHDWESPVWKHWWRALSEHHTLVRYDERGCGLSDWDVDGGSFTLDAWVRDLETIVDALGLERFPLLGLSQGGKIAITYAARHPDRVSHVIVYGASASSTWAHSDDERRRELSALGELIKTSWGASRPGFHQVYDAKFLPDGPIEAWRAFDELQRRSTSPGNAHRFWRAFGTIECAEAARALDVPTLILHCEGDELRAFEEAEELHAMVAGSRLVRLASRNHILQADEPAFAVFVDEVERFLAA